MKLSLVLLVASILMPVVSGSCDGHGIPVTKIRPIEGNAETPLIRFAPSAYTDTGGGMPKGPNARNISNMISYQNGQHLSSAGFSDMLWQWGQFLDHDIDLTENSPAFGEAPIDIPDDDPALGDCGAIPFGRSHYIGTPREQPNMVTSFIDASQVYGSSENRAAALRTYHDGKLKTSAYGLLLPKNTEGLDNGGGKDAEFYVGGDIRVNEHVGLVALHTLFVREHNRLAHLIAKKYKTDCDEFIYQLARKLVGAEMQIVTYNEFLPLLLGSYAPYMEDYRGYESWLDPQISNTFSTVAFRLGHSLVSSTLKLANKKGHVTSSMLLRESFFQTEFFDSDPYGSVDSLIAGLMAQQCQEIDVHVVEDVRSFLFAKHPGGETACLDLAALNIQRARDHGLPSYNRLRVAYGLHPKKSFAEVTSKLYLQKNLAAVYASVDEIDGWVGALAEDHFKDAEVGELIATVLREQFDRLMHADEYFFLNDPYLEANDLYGILDLQAVDFAYIIEKNTELKKVGNPFSVKKADTACS